MGISARFYAVPCYLPLTSYYSFPSSYCLLLSHYYLLHTTYYLLPTTLRVGEHLLFTICYLLTSERRGQVADHSFRAVVSACGLHAVHSTLRGVQLLTARVVSATPGTPTHYYSLPLTPAHSYSLHQALLLTTTHYHSLLLTPTHYYSLPLTTTHYYLLLLTPTHQPPA